MNTIDKLREHLFDTMQALKDGDMDVEDARAMSDIAQTVINSAKVEVEYLRAVGGKQSKFLESGATVATEDKTPDLPKGITGVHQHRIK
jgi:hypothetical protein